MLDVEERNRRTYDHRSELKAVLDALAANLVWDIGKADMASDFLADHGRWGSRGSLDRHVARRGKENEKKRGLVLTVAVEEHDNDKCLSMRSGALLIGGLVIITVMAATLPLSMHYQIKT